MGPRPGRSALAGMAMMAAAITAGRTAVADPPSYLDRGLVAEAARRAVTRAGLGLDVTRGMSTRSHIAAWLPTVSASVQRVSGGALTQTTTVLTDRLLVNDSLVMSVHLTMALDRLVFDPREAAIARAEVSRTERRMALETLVVELLTRLERARLERAALPPGTVPAVTLVLEAAEARARLELLVGASLDDLTRP